MFGLFFFFTRKWKISQIKPKVFSIFHTHIMESKIKLVIFFFST